MLTVAPNNREGYDLNKMSNLSHFSIGWICAIDTEIIAAELMFDETLSAPEGIPESDINSYSFGRISGHSVVVACLPQCQYGISNATAAVKDVLRSFPIKTVIMVGIAGGAPNLDNGVDIRLGDVVVSSPGINNGGVLQYGYGKKHQDDNDPLRFETTGHLNQPPLSVLNAVNQLKARHRMEGHQIQHTILDALRKRHEIKPKLKRELQRPDRKTDRLYQSSVSHVEGCKTCDSCGNDAFALVKRAERDPSDDDPIIHYGLVASADSLMKDAIMRDRLSRERGVLCFEMEAAGLMNHVPCVAVRGICDYSDSHKNKVWQGYAAMTAASYAKELLSSIRPNQMAAEKRLIDKIDAEFSNVSSQLRDVNARISSVKDSIHHDKISAWLSAPDPSTNLSRARNQHQTGTGQWFLQSETYSTWKSERNSFLWLNGIPGCGKTILSSSVVEDMKQTADKTHDVLYFYFDFNDVEKQSLGKCVRSLIHQLHIKREDVRRQLEALHLSRHDTGSLPDDEPLYRLLENIFKKDGEYWIILDALDECRTRNDQSAPKLLPWINCLRGMNLNIHIMVTSRSEQDITSSVEKWARSQDIICIQSNLVASDIVLYIKEKTKQMHRWQERPDVRDHIETVLSQKANGMFRWVSCQIDVLEECLDWPSVKRELNSLPTTLDATYQRILQNMKEQNRHATTRLLQFLTYMKRPLRLDEAVDVVAVDISQTPRFDPANRVQIPEEILRYCSSLVIMTSRQNKWDHTTIKEIQLAHFSVQEYLMSNRPKGYLTTDLERPNASAAILDTCLSYLLDIDHPRDRTEAKEKYPLAEYSAHFWLDYAPIVEKSTNKASPSVVEYLSSDRFQFIQVLYLVNLATVEVSLISSDNSTRIPWTSQVYESDKVDGLYCASYGGLFHATQALLSQGVDANAQWSDWDSALCVASNSGHANIVQILLEYDANVDAQWLRFGTALCAASAANHTNIIRILFAHGANIHVHQNQDALREASARANTESVRMLIDNGATVNDTVRMLPSYNDFGAEPTQHDPTPRYGYSWALIGALDGDHAGIVLMLLDKSGSSNDERLSVFTHAVKNGYIKTTQMLLDRLFDINDAAGLDNPLRLASSQGHTEIVRLLLGHGARDEERQALRDALHRERDSPVHGEVCQLLQSRESKSQDRDSVDSPPHKRLKTS